MYKYLSLLLLVLLPLTGSAQTLRLFYLSSVPTDTTRAFISLTDERLWVEEPGGSRSMEDISVYKDEPVDNSEDTRIVTGSSRNDFLEAIQIDDSSHIYIYNMRLDTLLVYRVKETALVERSNVYTGTETGFELSIPGLAAMGAFEWNTFVGIGHANPFQTGAVYAMQWQQVDKVLFPAASKPSNDSERYSRYAKDEVYQFSAAGYTYLLQNLRAPDQQGIQGRHLIVYEAGVETPVFNRVYLVSESLGLSELITEGEPYQWTGQIFKDKPPVLYGFQWVSFGCPWIEFIGSEEPTVTIYCDNRH